MLVTLRYTKVAEVNLFLILLPPTSTLTTVLLPPAADLDALLTLDTGALPAPPAAVGGSSSSRPLGGARGAVGHVDTHPLVKELICHAARAVDAGRPDLFDLRDVSALIVKEEHVSERHPRLACNMPEVRCLRAALDDNRRGADHVGHRASVVDAK